jgi:VanZ family protein
VVGWASLILVMTSWPAPPTIVPQVSGLDKVGHFGVYAILGYLVSRALPSPAAWPARLNALTAMAVFGFVDELHQLLIPGREASVWDWSADFVGATSGLLLGLHILSLARTRQDLPT